MCGDGFGREAVKMWDRVDDVHCALACLLNEESFGK